MTSGARRPPGPPTALVVLDVLGKAALVASLAIVLVDPAWGNLEGKAPTARALTYPLVAFAVPVWWLLRRPARAYPWLADVLLTVVAFSDILGNRLDLYDSVVWFDDLMHVTVVTCAAAGDSPARHATIAKTRKSTARVTIEVVNTSVLSTESNQSQSV